MSMRFLLMMMLLCSLSRSMAFGQSMQVKQTANKADGYQVASMKARVVFVSPSADLLIDENNGTLCETKEQGADGLYRYRFICDVTDTNKFKFNIALAGSTSAFSVTAFVEEGNDILYKVEVEEVQASIGEVKVDPNPMVYPVDNKAKATVLTTYPKLIVQSATGEAVVGPEYDKEHKQFFYSVVFDVAEQASRSVVRSLKLSADNKEFVTQELGPLSPKQAVDIAVVVIQESCYQHNISLAQNFFLNGAYKEAFDIYDRLLTTDECSDKPSDTGSLQENQKEMKRLANAYRISNEQFVLAEEFVKGGELDSAVQHHAEAYKYRNYILKRNPSDPYCLEYNRKFDRFKKELPRIITGKVVDNSRMDLQGNNLPIKDVYIIASVHKRTTKNRNGVAIPWYGDEIGDNFSRRELLGQTQADGTFRVYLKKNSPDEVYVLNFTADKNFTKRSHEFIYLPKDVDRESNLLIKITPKGLNKYNE